jgi:arsenate reductase
MAEGWARHLKGNIIEPFSAGLEAHGLNPRAAEVMAEADVDISAHRSQRIRDLGDLDLDYVVTVCGHADKNCPVFPGKTRVVHVGFDDPPKLAANAASDEEALSAYRRVRDEIRDFVSALPESLVANSST